VILFLTEFLVTYVSILYSDSSIFFSKKTSSVYRMLRYPFLLWKDTNSVICFSSLSSSAQHNVRQVSWYAFFQGWLLPSLPSCCFRYFTSFPLSKFFGTLFYVLGCFPFIHEASPSWIVYKALSFLVFLVYFELVTLLDAVLYTQWHTLHATYIAFAEYQLSPSLISLSPLISSHPPFFLQRSVRSSSFRLQSAQN